MPTTARSPGKKIAPLVLAGAAGLLALSPVVRANLNIALQFPDGSTTHTFTPVDLTTPVEIDVWAQLRPNVTYDGANANYPGTAADYTYAISNFGIYSSQVANPYNSTGGIVSAVLESWNGLTALPGPISDANNDGANDVGGVFPPAGASTLLASPKGAFPGGTAANSVSPAADVAPLPGGGFEFLVEKIYYQATPADLLAHDIDYYVLVQKLGSNAAVWIEDDDRADAGTIDTPSGPIAASLYTGTGEVFFTNVPEPLSSALLGLTSAGLLARRQRSA